MASNNTATGLSANRPAKGAFPSEEYISIDKGGITERWNALTLVWDLVDQPVYPSPTYTPGTEGQLLAQGADADTLEFVDAPIAAAGASALVIPENSIRPGFVQ